MRLKTFRLGGVHPPEGKLTAGAAVVPMPLPSEAIMLVSQHIGAPAEVVVQKGDTVKVGQLLAKSTGFVSANMHSSVSGTVTKIDKVLDASGYAKPAIYIAVDGDEWMEGIDRSAGIVRQCDLEPAEIIKRIGEAGIVGMGGATFPTHVKLSVPAGRKAEFLIINAVECEPYLTADHRVMLERGEEVMIGVDILRKALGNPETIIGIENNKPDAIAHLQKLAAEFPGITVQPLKVKYPQGGEKQLIEAVTRREVPAGKLPIDVGAVVQNVGTALAVYEAIQKNKPLIERVVTITGYGVKNPMNVLARVGTPITNLLEFAGGLTDDAAKVISGGPMMGKALKNLGAPVAKGTSGVLVMPERLAYREKEQQCIRCAKCSFGCPMGLEPYLLYRLAQRSMLENLEQEEVMSCIECGSCSYTCPAALPLLDFIRLGKGATGAMIRARNAKK